MNRPAAGDHLGPWFGVLLVVLITVGLGAFILSVGYLL